MENLILLNRMYAGDYLKKNIGHEIINLYRSDNNNNYIYVNPYGTMAKERDGKIKTILLVRLINQYTFEILAKAENLTQIITDFDISESNALYKKQIEYIHQKKISYGGITLDTIFKDNDSENVKESPQFITFKAENVSKTKCTIYITEKEDFKAEDNKDNKDNKVFFLSDKHFSKQSLKIYYSDIHQKEAYNVLSKIINDKSIWASSEESTFKVNLDEKTTREDYSFLTLIKKEYDELSYSNMLEYFLNLDSKTFYEFCAKILNINDFDGNYDIIREKEHHIDILIKGQNHIIVIENKIKSGINSTNNSSSNEKDGENQLQRYAKYVKDNYSNLESHCFLLLPDYNKIDISRYVSKDLYSTIFYSDVYAFFKNTSSVILHQNPYFKDFLATLHKQSRLVDSSVFEEMQERFIKAIKMAGENPKKA